MPEEISREGLRQLLAEGVQLVEVLPANEYEEDHLPGAISLPMRRAGDGSAESPRHRAPGHRVLLGLGVRHEPTGRLAARELGVHRGIRLRRGQAGLVVSPRRMGG